VNVRPARGDLLVATAAALALLPATCVVALESLPAARAWPLIALAALAHVAFVARLSAPVLSHVLVALTVAGMLALSGLFFLLPSALVFLLSVYACTAWGPRSIGLVTGVVGAAATVLRYRVDPSVTASPVGPSPWLLGLLLVALVVVAWTAGLLRRSQERVRREALAGRERAEAERAERAERAVLAERTRIAREMHDVVAHSLSVVVAQARVGRADPGRAAHALAVVEETGREALRDMRGIVRVLRAVPTGVPDGAADAAPTPTLGDLPDLVDRARRAGRAVRVVESGVPVPLGPTAELAAFRTVQEALTNSARHAAPGSSTTVTLAWRSAGLRVTVADVPPPDDAGATGLAPGLGTTPDTVPATGAGLGLVGMRERIEAAGGTLEIRAGDAWTVAATVPTSTQHALAPPRRADGGP
jgi:signal transduction histidine kinase